MIFMINPLKLMEDKQLLAESHDLESSFSRNPQTSTHMEKEWNETFANLGSSFDFDLQDFSRHGCPHLPFDGLLSFGMELHFLDTNNQKIVSTCHKPILTV